MEWHGKHVPQAVCEASRRGVFAVVAYPYADKRDGPLQGEREPPAQEVAGEI